MKASEHARVWLSAAEQLTQASLHASSEPAGLMFAGNAALCAAVASNYDALAKEQEAEDAED